MAHERNQIAWALVACAAIVAQIAPKAACQACDHPCCAAKATSPGVAGITVAGGCPDCATTADLRPTEADERPCHCQLNARHDQPLSSPRHTQKASADGPPAIAPTVAQPAVPPAIGVSREYAAASLAVPIRPPRILYGVWRE